MRAALVILLAAAGSAAAEPADEPAPFILVVMAHEAEAIVPSAALCTAIAEDLHAPVATETPPTAPIRGVLTIATDGPLLVLTYRNENGEETRRVVPRGEERATQLETIALIAGNLIRDEADELLVNLERQSPRPAATHTTEVIVDTPPVAGASAITRRVPTRSSTHPWSIGLLAFVSSRSAEPVYTTGSGFYVSRALGRHVAIGLTDLVMFQSEGRYVVSAGPYGEAFWFAKAWVQLFGQVGVPMQGRWGGNPPAAFGAQPFLGGGLRFWIGGRLSVGVGARVGIVATNSFGAPPTELTQGTITASGGLEVGFHL